MKNSSVLLITLFVGLFGCGRQPSTSMADYVGEYALRPNSGDTNGFPRSVVLKADGSALSVNASSRNATPTKWYISRGTDEQVVIGTRAYPIEMKKSTIRLVVNGDLGQYYEKLN